MGGDSILSIQVTSRALDEGVQFDPIDLFKTPTIAELALVATLVDTQERPVEERRERFDGISTTELDSVSQLLQRQTTLE